MTSAAKANRRADIVDRLEAENERLNREVRNTEQQMAILHADKDMEIERLRAGLCQIATVCKDNANVTDRGKAMALDFVHQVAAGAVNIHNCGNQRGQNEVSG